MKASVVFSATDFKGAVPGGTRVDARDVLEAAGIPCYLGRFEIPVSEPSSIPLPTHEWRVMVPGDFNLRAVKRSSATV
jgi:hypothetical protein